MTTEQWDEYHNSTIEAVALLAEELGFDSQRWDTDDFELITMIGDIQKMVANRNATDRDAKVKQLTAQFHDEDIHDARAVLLTPVMIGDMAIGVDAFRPTKAGHVSTLAAIAGVTVPPLRSIEEFHADRLALVPPKEATDAR